jgi:uncharacterized membrane protein YczE
MKGIFPRIICSWQYLARLVMLVFALFLYATGIFLMYRSGLGLGPWDVLHQGINRHTPLSFGQASIAVGAILIVGGLLLKVIPGVGTLLNMLLIGIFVDVHLHLNWLTDLSGTSLWLRLGVDALGVCIVGLGTALYITQGMGAGPRDGLMMRLYILTKVRVAVVRAALECSVLIIGFFLGGTVGLGTLVFAFGVGPAIEIGFWLVKKLHKIQGRPPVAAGQPYEHSLESEREPLHPA